jgi:hypothetical protein
MFVGLLCDTKTGCGQYDQDGLPSLALVQRTWRLLFFDWDPVEPSSAKFYLGPSISFLGSTRDCSYKKSIRKLRECCPMTLALTLLFTLTLYHKLQRA